MVTKKEIIDKSDILIRQYKKMGWDESIVYEKKNIMDFFSNDINLQEGALKAMKGSLNPRVWESVGFTSHNPNYPMYYKDEFVDEFNNFSDFYGFLMQLVKDTEEYHNARINHLDENKEN